MDWIVPNLTYTLRILESLRIPESLARTLKKYLQKLLQVTLGDVYARYF
jgi:hypothetical protein